MSSLKDVTLTAQHAENPFGTTISTQDIIANSKIFDHWEDRYEYIISLGKELPGLPDDKKTREKLVPGCQSQVWIDYKYTDGRVQFNVDADAFIVKGLLGVIMAAYNNKTPAQILEFDIELFFTELNLLKHLSPTRGNGLRSMIARIKKIAQKLIVDNSI